MDTDRTVHTLEDILSKPQAPKKEPLFEAHPVNLHMPQSLYPEFKWANARAEGGGPSSFESFKSVATTADAVVRRSVTPPVRPEP